MRIRFDDLFVQGFRSFEEERRITFSKRPGMFFISGKNNVQKDLGANGCGKSTIFDALCWALFDKTVRGVRGPSLINWTGGFHCQVIVRLTKGRQDFEIRRSLKPNTLSLTNRTTGESQRATNEEIVDLLGFGYRSFVSSVIMGQMTSWFFDLTPSGRLEVLQDSLQLDCYDRASTAAGGLVRESEAEERRASEDLATIEGAIEHIRKARTVARERSKAWRRSIAGSIETARSDLAKSERELDSAKKRIAKAKTDFERAEREFNKIEREMVKADTRKRAAREAAATARADSRHADEKCEEARAALRDFPESEVCPCCRSQITKAHRAEVLSDLESAVDERVEDKRNAGKKASRAAKKVDRASDSLREIDSRYGPAKASKEKLASRLSNLRGSVRAAERSLTNADSRVGLLREEENPHLVVLADLDEELATKKEARKDLRKKRRAAERAAARFGFWKTGMKEIRLLVVEEALRELEIHCNAALGSLGLRAWEISFDIERASSTGKSVRGFSTLIKSKWSGAAVPYESWSGGETQRLRIAGAIGISTLVRDRLGIDTNLEVWDEPTAHLSSEGVDDLVQTFQERSRELRRQVWMIDHHVPNHGNWTGHYSVRKTNHGTLIKKVPTL